jgi:hypothetical protein
MGGRVAMIRWLYDHYILTSVISLYYLVLIGYGTLQVFENPDSLTAPAASAYLTLMGLPAAIAALLRWRFDRDKPDS